MKNLLFVIVCFSIICCQKAEDTELKAEMVGAGIISTEAPEFGTSLNAEQNLLFFNRTTADRLKMRILYSKREGNNDLLLILYPFLSPDGKRLYFSLDRPFDGLHQDSEILNTWYVENDNAAWSDPIKPGYPLNSDSAEIFISMTKSGNAYFVSEIYLV